MKAVMKHLHDHILEPAHKGTIMYCLVCGAQYSANRGDYEQYPSTYIFMCCDEPCILGRMRTDFVEE